MTSQPDEKKPGQRRRVRRIKATRRKSFEYQRRRMRHTLMAHSRKQDIPGLDADDVLTELLTALWLACQTYDPRFGQFNAYFWSCWFNRRADISEQQWRRRHHIDCVDPAELPAMASPVYSDLSVVDELCPDSTEPERTMWRLLAQGADGQAIRRTLGLSIWRYYRIINRWKENQSVRDALGK